MNKVIIIAVSIVLLVSGSAVYFSQVKEDKFLLPDDYLTDISEFENILEAPPLTGYEKSSWKTYNNETYNYSFLHPEEYGLGEAILSDRDIFFRNQSNPNREFSTIRIRAEQTHPSNLKEFYGSMIKYFDREKERLSKNKDVYEGLLVRKTSFKGYEAFYSEVLYTQQVEENKPVIESSLHVYTNRQLYSIKLFENGDNAVVLKKILSTLEIN